MWRTLRWLWTCKRSSHSRSLVCVPRVYCRSKIVVLRGSPADYLLVRANGYRGPIHHADTVDEALSILVNNADEAVLLTDALVADHIANKASIHPSICIFTKIMRAIAHWVLNNGRECEIRPWKFWWNYWMFMKRSFFLIEMKWCNRIVGLLNQSLTLVNRNKKTMNTTNGTSIATWIKKCIGNMILIFICCWSRTLSHVSMFHELRISGQNWISHRVYVHKSSRNASLMRCSLQSLMLGRLIVSFPCNAGDVARTDAAFQGIHCFTREHFAIRCRTCSSNSVVTEGSWTNLNSQILRMPSMTTRGPA